jgi:aconitate hydratase 2/2-methylisocitrate dehydratase
LLLQKVSSKDFTAVEKYSIKNSWYYSGKFYAGSDTCRVNIVGSQDTTGLMTSQELESMAAL